VSRWLRLRRAGPYLALVAAISSALLLSACQGLVTLPTTVNSVTEIAVTPTNRPGACVGLCGLVDFTVGGPPTRSFACYVQVTRLGTPTGAGLVSDSPPAGNQAPMDEVASFSVTGLGAGAPVDATANCVSAEGSSG
jgi:hypothetical protein